MVNNELSNFSLRYATRCWNFGFVFWSELCKISWNSNPFALLAFRQASPVGWQRLQRFFHKKVAMTSTSALQCSQVVAQDFATSSTSTIAIKKAILLAHLALSKLSWTRWAIHTSWVQASISLTPLRSRDSQSIIQMQAALVLAAIHLVKVKRFLFI